MIIYLEPEILVTKLVDAGTGADTSTRPNLGIAVPKRSSHMGKESIADGDHLLPTESRSASFELLSVPPKPFWFSEQDKQSPKKYRSNTGRRGSQRIRRESRAASRPVRLIQG